MEEEAIKSYSLDDTLTALQFTDKTYIKYHINFAARAFDLWQHNDKPWFEFEIDNDKIKLKLRWTSVLDNDVYSDPDDIAQHGAVGLAMFVMSVLKRYNKLTRTSRGTGVDYWFSNTDKNDLNFLANSHYVEVSGIFEEKTRHELKRRIKFKQNQISKGDKKKEIASVLVTLFSRPITVKELHNEPTRTS